MRVMIIGSGGREHTLAWKIAQSTRLEKLYCAPGNPGMGALAERVDIPATAVEQLTAFAVENHMQLVVIGPEQALDAGLADSLTAAGIPVFGPSRKAARIETSKSFSKAFMQRCGILTARFAVFCDPTAAHEHLNKIEYPVVIKACGLAAGKGVLLPDSMEEAHRFIDRLMVAREFGNASAEIVIEERLIGEEVSLMAFCDGKSAVPMLPAQDHKRLLDGDAGPNTGGMGAYAPVSSFTAEDIDQAVKTILQPAVDGLRAEGTPFTGVLYAGLMVTRDGPRVLEFNARFGDPETQVILPLLEGDLLEVLLACTVGRLSEIELRWKPACAACVILASAGYPEKPQKGQRITLPETLEDETQIFHAGTLAGEGGLVTSGGRVLAAAAQAGSFSDALQKTYRLAGRIFFEGMHYRRDVGSRESQRARELQRVRELQRAPENQRVHEKQHVREESKP